MADEGKRGTYASTLADRKSKRLESALSSYSSDETKKAVGRLLEAYMDEGGKNYFGAGRRDTTLYFADDEYIKEIEKEKASPKGLFKSMKKNVHTAEAEEAPEAEKTAKTEEETKQPTVTYEPTIIMDPAAKKQINGSAQADTKPEDTDLPSDNIEEEQAAVSEAEEAHKSTEEETSGMKYDDENEYEETPDEEIVPRRRRSKAAPAPEPEKKTKKKPAPPEPEEEEEEDIFDDDFDEDYDDEYYDDDEYEDEGKGGLFSIFKRKKYADDDDDDEYEDDDEFDEDYEEYADDDDEYYDDDDEYEDNERAVSVKKIFHIIFIVLLICAVAALAAMCYSYKNNYESARQQIEDQLQGENGVSPAEQINQLKAQVEQLKAENEKLKSGNAGNTAQDNTEENSSAPSNSTESTADGAPSSVVDDTSGASVGGTTYTVKAGDNNARKLCTSVYGEYSEELWQKLCEANGKSGTDFIVNETIIVP